MALEQQAVTPGQLAGQARQATAPPAGRSRPQRPSGLLTLDQLVDHVTAGHVDTVLLAAPDMQGRLKGKRHGARHFVDRVLSGGAEMCAYVFATDVDMRPLDGYALTSWESGYGDVRLLPDPGTVRMLPWIPGAALVFADALDTADRPVEVAPRHMLHRQLEGLRRHGLSAKVGLESEFVLYRGTHHDLEQSGHRELRPIVMTNLDYSLDMPRRTDTYLRRLQAALAGAGLPVEAVKGEGSPGQVEVTFPYGDPLRACDGHVVFKHAVRHTAERAGMAPTFMAAPDTGVASGCHVHLSLWRGDEPVFAERDGRLPETAREVVAGLLDALPDLAPLYAPNPNSYKRYRAGSFAPTAFTWGRDNRTCAVRVVGHDEGLHLEVRLPGADVNPYLALTAVLAAAQHGIDHELPLPPPQTGNAYQATGDRPVPATLHEALEAFRNSKSACRILGPAVVEHYSRAAEIELDVVHTHVTDVDRQRGFARA
ncbi:glutamine synthetase family protein [Streptomyces iakyrus]|uniref:glutamine synthetase family protein n=1 Tax=Streptomyces iakyrus TaxID=68219 RepID=UPI000996F4CA|nr:glutamine synthetase family protein [Streptomyces iakyrus]